MHQEKIGADNKNGKLIFSVIVLYMKLLIPLDELELVKQVPCECINCNSIFYISKSCARRGIKGTRKNDFCSHRCNYDYKTKLMTTQCSCLNCKKSFIKKNNQTKRSNNHFCSRSCAVTFNNKNKTTGIRRSKLESWLELKLSYLYPNLEIHYNRKDTINGELDIYIPSLKLAFEINGIFHYEPIYGEDKLKQINSNDNRKFQACLEHGIELCIIDSSKLTYFKESSAQKYLDIILNIINNKNSLR